MFYLMSAIHWGQAEEFPTLQVQRLCLYVESSTQLLVFVFWKPQCSCKDERQVLNRMLSPLPTLLGLLITQNLFNDSSHPIIMTIFSLKAVECGGRVTLSHALIKKN